MSKNRQPLPQVHDIAAVIFDLDGVLVDSEPIHFRAANRVLARYRTAISETEYRTFIGLGEVATWEAWQRHLRLPTTVEELLAAHTLARVDEIVAGVVAIDAAVDLARRLHTGGVPLAIASSSTAAIIDALVNAIGLDSVFLVRVSGEDPEVHQSKPAPDVYRLAAARLGCAAYACLAIEDSGPGVRAAKGAGMTCIAVPNRWTAEQDFSEADIVMESLRYFPLVVW